MWVLVVEIVEHGLDAIGPALRKAVKLKRDEIARIAAKDVRPGADASGLPVNDRYRLWVAAAARTVAGPR